MERQKFVIGLAGLPGSGKTTVARILEEERGYRRLSFGGRLKETAKLVYGLDGPEERFLYGTQEDKEEIIPRLGISGRFILQRLGTEVCRSIHPGTWILAVQEQIVKDSKDSNQSRFVIDDVRFQNELDFVKSWGIVWLVDRPEVTERYRELQTHSAEKPDLLKGIDRRIVNAQDLDSLRRTVYQLLQ